MRYWLVNIIAILLAIALLAPFLDPNDSVTFVLGLALMLLLRPVVIWVGVRLGLLRRLDD